MANIAEQIENFYKVINPKNDLAEYDHTAIAKECDENAIEVNQDYDNETTKHIFADGSVLIANSYGEYTAYAMDSE